MNFQEAVREARRIGFVRGEDCPHNHHPHTCPICKFVNPSVEGVARSIARFAGDALRSADPA